MDSILRVTVTDETKHRALVVVALFSLSVDKKTRQGDRRVSYVICAVIVSPRDVLLCGILS